MLQDQTTSLLTKVIVSDQKVRLLWKDVCYRSVNELHCSCFLTFCLNNSDALQNKITNGLSLVSQKCYLHHCENYRKILQYSHYILYLFQQGENSAAARCYLVHHVYVWMVLTCWYFYTIHSAACFLFQGNSTLVFSFIYENIYSRLHVQSSEVLLSCSLTNQRCRNCRCNHGL